MNEMTKSFNGKSFALNGIVFSFNEKCFAFNGIVFSFNGKCFALNGIDFSFNEMCFAFNGIDISFNEIDFLFIELSLYLSRNWLIFRYINPLHVYFRAEPGIQTQVSKWPAQAFRVLHKKHKKSAHKNERTEVYKK